ncbi:hypothetical protein B0H16DRAFT_517990 [Mycena metata]|uniref:Novel STAND NTPase 1 domain-containing protein n=1 Tax=Mycena metata TaxID=1033252 RepID=A0AAD7NIK1_9AGAR|nr:hypothetical protein B0H16DRAFT_517990 [Mycena metata]
MLPAEPRIFHGRDSELAAILKLFHDGTPRITILGAGGMGKTSLARIALHHEEITIKYQDNRFFIACDIVSTKVELAGLIGAHLGMKPGKDLTQAVLWYFSDAPPSLLILDNLETLWEPAESRRDIEEFLSLLTGITTLALLVTMRGAERPGKVRWTQPFLLPLQPLAQEAARQMFLDIADDKQSMEEIDKVLHLTDNMPLSISLLAHLVDIEGCTKILSRWETEKTSLISDGYDKRSNLELSISLSLSSPRMTSMPHSQDLLALLSILPDGLSDVELMQSKFPVKDILGCKVALLRTALAYTDDQKHLRVLVPVREYMGRLFPPTKQMITPLLTHFHELLELYRTAFGKESGGSTINRITSNYKNIQNVLQYGLQSEHPELVNNIYCTCDFNHFSRRIGHGGIPLLNHITPLLPSLDDHRLKVYFIVERFNSFKHNPISEPELLIAQALDHLKHFDDPEIESRLHNSIGFYYCEHNHGMSKANEHCQIALLLAQANGDYKSQCEALEILAFVKWLCGNYTAGQAYAQEGQKLAKISGDFHREARGLHFEIMCLKALGHYRHCISLSMRARTLLYQCGMSHGDVNYALVSLQAAVHKSKSEYAEARNIQNQILQELLAAHDIYNQALALLNIAGIEIFMGVSKNLIQEKIDASQAIVKVMENARLIAVCNITQANLNLREGDTSSVLLHKCLNSGWGNFSVEVSHCLELLGDHSHWEGSHPSSWTIVFLAHSLKRKQKPGIHKALQFLGDVFLRNNDKITAISLFTLALEGFTQMDVHQSRAECMMRLGDISKENSDLLGALELWETARPLFEYSSQIKQVQDIDERLSGISEAVRQQHRINLTQLAELTMGKVEEVAESSLEDKLGEVSL